MRTGHSGHLSSPLKGRFERCVLCSTRRLAFLRCKKKGKSEDNAEPEHSAVLRSTEPKWPSRRGQVRGSACGSHPNGWQTGETAQEAFRVINPLSRKTLHHVCAQDMAWLAEFTHAHNRNNNNNSS